MRILLAMLMMISLAACTSMRIESDKEPATNIQESKAYYFLWGIWPHTKLRTAESMCSSPSKWAATKMEYSFTDVAITVITAGIVIPQTMTTECR